LEKYLNIKASAIENIDYYELKQHKLWFGEECKKLLDHRKQAKLHWLQNVNQTNGDNQNNARHETSRTFRNKTREYFKEKINQFDTDSKNRNM
jgi:hypothetical protein